MWHFLTKNLYELICYCQLLCFLIAVHYICLLLSLCECHSSCISVSGCCLLTSLHKMPLAPTKKKEKKEKEKKKTNRSPSSKMLQYSSSNVQSTETNTTAAVCFRYYQPAVCKTELLSVTSQTLIEVKLKCGERAQNTRKSRHYQSFLSPNFHCSSCSFHLFQALEE